MVFLLAGGLVLLVAGAEALVKGASKIAAAVGIPSLVVGLTVVAFGTSAPELAVSIGSSMRGQAGLALGNVVGSNIFNVLVILGASALAAPLIVSFQLIRLDVPLSIGSALGVLLLAMDGTIGRADGALLVGALVVYLGFLFVKGLRASGPSGGEADAEEDPAAQGQRGQLWAWGLNGGLVGGGLAGLVLGADWFLEGAVMAARRLGVSELVIGLTIAAGGTSLPELVTSLLAGLRGERDIAVGNVVGSNLFNLLSVLGLTALVAPNGVPVPEAALWFDLPVMIAALVACLPIFITGHRIARWEGGLFLGYYGAYVTYLFLAATQHDALASFSTAMAMFVGPLTVITLGISVLRSTGRSQA